MRAHGGDRTDGREDTAGAVAEPALNGPILQFLEKSPAGGNDQIRIVGVDVVEPPLAVRPLVTAVAGGERGGKVRRDHNHQPIALHQAARQQRGRSVPRLGDLADVLPEHHRQGVALRYPAIALLLRGAEEPGVLQSRQHHPASCASIA